MLSKTLTILLLLTCFLCVCSAAAQFSEDFSSPVFPPSGWAVFDNGIGTVRDWVRSTERGGGAAVNYYEAVSSGTAQDYLATPLLQLTAEGDATLSFRAGQAYGSYYGSVFQVRVSTGSQTTIGDYTTLASWTESQPCPGGNVLPTSGLTDCSVDLSAYAEQEIYIAFVHINDDGDSFYVDDVVVTGVQTVTPPAISAIPDQFSDGELPTVVAFTVADAETDTADLTLSVTSSNPALLPEANISFGGSGANRTATLTPVDGVFGFSTVAITVTDADGQTATTTFLFSVAVTITVTSASDETNPLNGDCTLREAIEAANTGVAVDACVAGSEASTIVFSPAIDGTTILLGTTLTLSGNLFIDGATGLTQGITVQGNAAERVFLVSNTALATISDLTITGGLAASGNSFERMGGGIANEGTLTIRNCTIMNNAADFAGGGVVNFNQLTVLNSTFTENTAGVVSGGAIYNYDRDNTGTTMATIRNSTIYQNNSGVTNFAAMVLSNNIIYANAPGASCDNATGGQILASTQNVMPPNTCGGTYSTDDPELGPFGKYGGVTQTFLPLAHTSVAVDAGDPAYCPATDQRGTGRPVDGNNDGTATCDIGAIEATFGELPVELTAFTATRDQARVLLSWTTASETNNAGFEVQRADTGTDWQTLGFVAGSGTTTEARSYTYAVEDPAPGRYRFRLKQVDYDGQFDYSPEVETTVGVAGTFDLRHEGAHPVRDRAVLRLAVAQAQQVTVDVMDVLGRRVTLLHAGPMAADASVVLAWPVSDVAAGIYFVRVTGDRFTETRRLIVVK